MSCINVTASQLSFSPLAFAARGFELKNAPTYTSSYMGRKLPKISWELTPAASRYRQVAPICVFGGKGKSDNGGEASPWSALDKAMSNFKKDQSIEDLLRQQMQKQEYYDDGDSGGKGRGGGGGGGDGDGFGEAEDGGLPGMWDEFLQVILATVGFIFLYIYIIEGEEITVIVKDFLKFLFRGQKSIRLRRLMNQWKRFFEKMTEKEEYDPYWLEREIINTPTMYDSPAKYRRILKAYLRSSSYE